MKIPSIRSIDILTFLGLLLLFVLPLYYYDILPEEVPRHFNSKGEVDGWWSKKYIFIMSVLGTFMYAIIYFSGKVGGLNLPSSRNKENLERDKNLTKQFSKWMGLFIVLLFNYISFTTIQVALGVRDGLSAYFTPIFFSIILIGISIYIFKTRDKSS